jgi:SAM-dependent methyltransferase/FMN phosphatase YigB (HAD superfamily)
LFSQSLQPEKGEKYKKYVTEFLKNPQTLDINVKKADKGVTFCMNRIYQISNLPVQQAQPGKIAVHLHLYYIDMADELLSHIAKMPFAFDLFITVVNREQAPFVEQKARQLCGSHLANLHVIIVPNRGRDIAAFFVALGSSYQQYDYLCHVHSKKSLFTGTVQKGWCDHLFESLFKDEDHLRRIFGLFAANPKIGLVYPTTAKDIPYWGHSWLSNNRSAHELFSRLKVEVDLSSYIDFPAGSMLWARSKALQPLFGLKLTFEDFPSEPIPNDGTLCHAIERSFCISGDMKHFTFAELDIHEGNFLVGQGKKNLWQYWNLSSDHFRKTLQKFQAISFDVFDTLVTRPLLDQDHAFLLAQHKIERELHIEFDFYEMRKKAEELARARLKPGSDASIQAIYKCFEEITGLPPTSVDRIRQIEIENDIQLALPRKGMIDVVTLLQREGKKIVFLSDMFLSSDVIRLILAKHGLITSNAQILVSSETGMRKDTGEIWRLFLQRIAQVHVGDNECSDVQLAVDNGVPQYHVMSSRRLFELVHPMTQLAHRDALADSIYAGPVVARLFSSPFALHSTRGQLHISDPKELGYCVFGPVLLYFTTWLYKRSHELGIHRLLFLAREGYLLQDLFEMFIAQFGDTGVRSSYLLCSRRGNSVPTIERETDIRAILEAPYNGSMANLLETRFGIDLDAASKDGTLSHQRLYNDIIRLPKEIDVVYEDVLKFKDAIYKHAEKEKKSYLAYLKRMEISKEIKTAVVDIGFAGTIHKYLQKLTAIDLHGFYFVTGQKARSNHLAKNMYACFGSFVEFNQGNCIYDYSLILESVLTVQAGQFIRFDDDGQPVFGRNAHTEATWPIIRAIHLGIIEYFSDAFKWFGDALLVCEPHVDTAVHFFQMISLYPMIVSDPLRAAMIVDDFYANNVVVNAFRDAPAVKESIASQRADIEFVTNYLAERSPDDHARFRSQQEFNVYLSSRRYDYEERLLAEKVLSNISIKSGKLDYSGYCDCCGKTTKMQSNWNFSDATMNHKAYLYNYSAYADWYGKALLFREQLICSECSLNNRQRGVFYAAAALGLSLPTLDVYAYEQVTPFYVQLQKKAPRAVGSEYLGIECRGGEVYNGIRHEDALDLSFADASFDLLIANDVFEHVPDIERALKEASRVLKPGGMLLYSIPFDLSVDQTVRRARLQGGRIDHLAAPIYHGNPVSNEGSLVFYDFGWDIIDICRRSGFDDSFMLYYYSPKRLLLGGGLQFIFVGINSGTAQTGLRIEQFEFLEPISMDKDISCQDVAGKKGDTSNAHGDAIQNVVSPDGPPTVFIPWDASERDGQIAALKEKNNFLREKINNLKEKNNKLKAHTEKQARIIKEKNTVISQLKSSTSWRITRPLRSIARLLRGK